MRWFSDDDDDVVRRRGSLALLWTVQFRNPSDSFDPKFGIAFPFDFAAAVRLALGELFHLAKVDAIDRARDHDIEGTCPTARNELFLDLFGRTLFVGPPAALKGNRFNNVQIHHRPNEPSWTNELLKAKASALKEDSPFRPS